LPGPGEWVAVVVSDTGHGMSREVQARMFEPFFTTRGDRPGTQGTGLGLATVQRIVAEVGGQIDVTSAPGEGTTVTIYFPRVAKMPPVDETAAHERSGPAPNSIRVLVVEDEPSVRSLVGNVLLGEHYRVMVARDGEEALRLIEAEREPFDLIVTDLAMPKVGGATLAQRLRERGNAPRFLFISGYSDHTPMDLLPYGKLLSKPFTPAQLLIAVRGAFEDPMR
jgi:CheY-like chemotaxis protein